VWPGENEDQSTGDGHINFGAIGAAIDGKEWIISLTGLFRFSFEGKMKAIPLLANGYCQMTATK